MVAGYRKIGSDPVEFHPCPHELTYFRFNEDWEFVDLDEALEEADETNDAAAIATYLTPVTVAQLDAIAVDQTVTYTGTPAKAEKVLQLLAALAAAV